MTISAMHHIFVSNNLLSVPAAHSPAPVLPQSLATVLANMAYYGFAPALSAIEALRALTADDLMHFWTQLEPVLKEITGSNRDMAEVVVYKNFPSEVLAMSEAQYWYSQLFMYLGAPAHWFTEEPAQRAPLNESLRLKILALASDDALQTIFTNLKESKARWTPSQLTHAIELSRHFAKPLLALSSFGFKENGVKLMAATLDVEQFLEVPDATDVLRLAAAMSEEDVALRESITFRNFNRSERQLLLTLLETTKNLTADMALRPTLWKKLLRGLHPGDYSVPRVSEAYAALYKGTLKSFGAKVEVLLEQKDVRVLELFQSRPGEFARQLHSLYGLFGEEAITAFASVANKLDTSQLLKLKGYVTTINERKSLMYPPRGNWNKVQLLANTKRPFDDWAKGKLLQTISTVLQSRLSSVFPQGVYVAPDAQDVKLQTNDQELAPYGRGTVFTIPENIQFLRTASYWELADPHQSVWFDNGWAFFDAEFQPLGACTWDAQNFNDAAVLSGDPTNINQVDGRACQMIDLYLDKLADKGVQYAVWSVLSYNTIPFANAKDVLATLQWGADAEKGNLYEPSRAQMVFPLKGQSLSKYVAYLDVAARKVVYMDVNLPARVSSVTNNLAKLSRQLPSFMEYVQSLPSLADLFELAPHSELPNATAILYSDKDIPLPQGATAYVFKQENPENTFEPLALAPLLATK